MEHSDEARRLDKLYDRLHSKDKRIKELKTLMQDTSNQLIELYDKCNETTEPEVYGTILGLHEKLEQTLKG